MIQKVLVWTQQLEAGRLGGKVRLLPAELQAIREEPRAALAEVLRPETVLEEPPR